MKNAIWIRKTHLFEPDKYVCSGLRCKAGGLLHTFQLARHHPMDLDRTAVSAVCYYFSYTEPILKKRYSGGVQTSLVT